MTCPPGLCVYILLVLFRERTVQEFGICLSNWGCWKEVLYTFTSNLEIQIIFTRSEPPQHLVAYHVIYLHVIIVYGIIIYNEYFKTFNCVFKL